MTGKKIIDLTLAYSSKVAGFSSSPSKTVEKDGWNASHLEFYSHSGTHMDAPFHFGVSNKTIEDIEPDRLILTCHKASIEVNTDSYLITTEELKAVLDKIRPGEGLIIQTGWSGHLGKDRYRNGLPRISKQLAEEIVNKKISFIGVEPPSVADVNDLKEVTEIHHILLKANVIIVEGLTNLESLEKDIFTVIALPLKIENGDGAPARVIAIVE